MLHTASLNIGGKLTQTICKFYLLKKHRIEVAGPQIIYPAICARALMGGCNRRGNARAGRVLRGQRKNAALVGHKTA